MDGPLKRDYLVTRFKHGNIFIETMICGIQSDAVPVCISLPEEIYSSSAYKSIVVGEEVCVDFGLSKKRYCVNYYKSRLPAPKVPMSNDVEQSQKKIPIISTLLHKGKKKKVLKK